MKRITKKIWHKFFINENGAVSVYLIIIALLLLLFNAVLIDYARILIAERQTEEAAKAALRSTMSAYNTSLQDKGLFALDGNQGEAETIFREVFQKNLSTGEGEHFDFLGLKPVDSEISLNINLERSLANKDILKYQILEEMKYKAPVEVGEAVIKNFLSVAEQVEQASDYAKLAKKLNDYAKDREKELDEAEKLLKEAKEILDNMSGRVQPESVRSNYPKVSVTYDIFYYHDRYKREMELIEEAERDNGNTDGDDEGNDEEVDVEELRRDTTQFKRESLSLLEDLINETTVVVSKLQDALDLIESAERTNNEMRETINNHESSSDYDNAKSISEDLEESTIGDNTDGSLEDYIYPEEMFTNLKETVEQALRKITNGSNIENNALLNKLSREFRPDVQSDFETRAKRNILGHVEDVKEYHGDGLSKVEKALEILADGRKDYIDNKDAIEEEEDKADEGMEDTKNQLDDIQDQIESLEGAMSDTQLLAELGQIASEYGEAIAANNKEFSMEDRNDTAEEALTFIDILFKNLGDLLLTARDEVYINEYILMRFKSHDFSVNGSAAYAYENNQVEYIIYGLESYGANYFAALSEIFAVRFAINLAAGFMRPEARGFGPFIWAYALGYAFTRTSTDLGNITRGRAIELFPGKSLPTMDYKDHLRLFLFAHLEGGKFQRLMAVLDNETGKDLRESPTYVTAEATATVKLWFLPQVINMLESTNVINVRVEGNEFFIEKEVNFSY
ncbi:hypothetical protein H8S33_11015 [Ornithinibacillus sp. BX22]|uniref:Uncharacterized protein n=1 Tax=Ornithinibacillus hominis TaxID=2763055 RepID=A0A923L6D4_9BACI|nr:DUF5702 domain-containing protein [Ornithinibacillus hominis]MBC5637335.1 hypothetical protein [Ornithinibacillus hominis]